MSVDQTDQVDFATIDKVSGALWLTISDHLPWCENFEEEHLILLQKKLNSYLSFIESGEIYKSIPAASGRKIVINIAGKFQLSEMARLFLSKARSSVEESGLQLRFKLMNPIDPS